MHHIEVLSMMRHVVDLLLTCQLCAEFLLCTLQDDILGNTFNIYRGKCADIMANYKRPTWY